MLTQNLVLGLLGSVQLVQRRGENFPRKSQEKRKEKRNKHDKIIMLKFTSTITRAIYKSARKDIFAYYGVSKKLNQSNWPSFLNRSSETSLATVSNTDKTIALSKPIEFDIQSKIEGHESQILTVDLEPNQVLRAETGSLLYMDDGIEMETSTGGGMSAGFKRLLTGENFFITDFKYSGDKKGVVALGSSFPSKLIRISLDSYGGSLICQKGAFLAGK